MRRIAVPAAASVVLHAAIATWLSPARSHLVVAVEEITAIEMVVIEEPGAVAAAARAIEDAPASPRRVTAPGSGSGSGSRSVSESGSGSGSGSESGSGSGSESESESESGSGSGVRLNLDPSLAAARIASSPYDGPFHPPARRGTSELRPDGTRGYLTEQRGFTARTAPDGSVTFDDRQGGLAPPPSAEELAAQSQPQQTWVDEPWSVTGGGGVLAPHGQVEFDASDGLMRAVGIDPYLAQKLAFMDRTREERMQMAASHQSESLREALHRMPGELERAWRSGDDAARRRRLLFQLWDECAETGAPQVVATARAVRGTVLAFIRRRLPRGSRDAYRADELAELNRARTSRQRFAPY